MEGKKEGKKEGRKVRKKEGRKVGRKVRRQDAPQPHLDGKHIVFGQIADGEESSMDILRQIEGYLEIH